MNNGKKDIISIIVGVVLIVLMAVYFGITAVGDLVLKTDVKTVKADCGYLCVTNEHTIAGLIPMGKDYYYCYLDVTGESTGELGFVRGPKNWLNKNFDANGLSVNNDGYVFQGKRRRLDYKVEDAVKSIVIDSVVSNLRSSLSGSNVSVSQADQHYYIDATYESRAIAKVVALVILLILAVGGAIFKIKGIRLNNPGVAVGFFVCLMAMCFAALYGVG
ncbi:MAG: hypothetical protein K6F84_09035 [Lachnospiraceae bacterium]|nr:hypothetical protein [Lachnospiraceae bacterium]